jgi:hypothetical protein
MRIVPVMRNDWEIGVVAKQAHTEAREEGR